jgi:serine/threonine-protein kinase
MGVVFKARHRPTGVERAVKIIELDRSDADLVSRFQREAATLARVDGHANIVRVHETGIEGHRAFYAMDLVEGRSLKSLLAEGPMEPGPACDLMAKVARAIAHCHAHGIVHRDLKPENVLLDGEGEPRLVDFGLVRDIFGKRLTHTGTFLGTPAYMSPEQVRGEPAVPKSDVHALGLILYEALAGVRPFRGNTVVEIAEAILRHDFVPLARRRPDIPSPLARLVERALDARTDARPEARELARSLEGIARALAAERDALVPAGRLRGYRRVALVLGGVVLLLGVSVGLLGWKTRDDRLERLEATRGLGALARSSLGRDDVAALILGRAAVALAAANDLEADPGCAETIARAALARGTDAFAVAAATSALAVAPGKREDLLLLRARARIGARDVDGALADLAGMASPEAQRLRVLALVVGRRFDELLALPGSDAFLVSARAVARFAHDVPGATEERIRELAGDARRADRDPPVELRALLSELRARAEIAAVASLVGAGPDSIPITFNLATARVGDQDAIFRPLATAAKELEQAFASPRYLDLEGDLGWIDLALTVIEGQPANLVNATRTFDEARKLPVRFEKMAIGIATRPEDAITHRVRTFIAILRLQQRNESERRAFLEENVGKGPPRVDWYLRIGLLLEKQNEYALGIVSAREAAETFREHLEHVDESVPMANGQAGARAQLEAFLGELLVRATGEDPAAKDALLAEADRHVAAARAMVERAEARKSVTAIVRRDIARAATLIALGRGDLDAAREALRGFGDEQAHTRDYAELLLRAEVKRRDGDTVAAESTLRSALTNGDDLAFSDTYTQWFAYDWAMAYAALRAARGDAEARRELEKIAERATKRRPLPWLDDELRRMFGR